MQVGPYDIDNKSTAVIENIGHSGFDGLLGMDILGSIQYQIDFAGRKIIWSPQKYQQMKVTVDAIKDAQDEIAAPIE